MHIDIPRLEKLSKLQLTDAERAMMELQLPSIIDYVAKLQEVDTSSVDPKAYITDVTNVFRADDIVADNKEHDAVLAAFPERMGTALQVPSVKVAKKGRA